MEKFPETRLHMYGTFQILLACLSVFTIGGDIIVQAPELWLSVAFWINGLLLDKLFCALHVACTLYVLIQNRAV